MKAVASRLRTSAGERDDATGPFAVELGVAFGVAVAPVAGGGLVRGERVVPEVVHVSDDGGVSCVWTMHALPAKTTALMSPMQAMFDLILPTEAIATPVSGRAPEDSSLAARRPRLPTAPTPEPIGALAVRPRIERIAASNRLPRRTRELEEACVESILR